jgi:hypothetical protein
MRKYHHLGIPTTVPRPGEYYLLLYLNNIAKKTQDIAFQAYSTDGKLLATIKINPGDYQVLNPYFLNFSRNYLYTTLEKKGGDGSQFFARVNLEGEPASRFPVASPGHINRSSKSQGHAG